MAVPFYGDYDTTETVVIPFNTFSSDDPSASVTVTNLAAGDVEIHKDGSTTQRASDNGVTVSVDFDSITGNHIVSIDLSDNSDAGFYAAGSRYQVRIEGATVDGATINAWIGAFSIGCVLRPTTDGRTLDVNATGEAGADVIMISGSSTAADNAEIVFDTDFETNYNATRNAWVTNAQDFVGTTAADPFNGQVVSASVTAGVSLGNGAITNASLAGNMEIVFETDFATNYDTDNNKWQTEADVTKWKGSAPADLTDTDKVQVSVQHMANSIIAAANIASDAIAAAKIANGAITAAKLGADCITSDKIADDAIGDEHWNVTSVSANLSDAAKLSIQKIAAGGIR